MTKVVADIIIDGPHGWSDEMGYGADHLAPIVLGSGTPSWSTATAASSSNATYAARRSATHLTYALHS